MPVEHLFTTPIYYNYVPSEQITAIDKEIQNIELKIKEKDLSNPWLDGVKTTFKYGQKNNNVLDYGLQNLATVIYENAAEYLNQLGIKKAHIEIEESWFNFCRAGDYQEAHCHPNNDICAVYFYRTNTEDGKLRFFSPSVSHATSKIFAESSNFVLHDLVDYTPEVGKLIIFPGFLRHAVMQNKTTNERVSIAANIKVTL